MNYREVFAAGQREQVPVMLLEPWLPMEAWERSNSVPAREREDRQGDDTVPRGQLLPDILSEPECYNAQLEEISAIQRHFSRNTSADHPTML